MTNKKLCMRRIKRHLYAGRDAFSADEGRDDLFFSFEIIPIMAQNTIMRYIQLWSCSATEYLFENRVIFISNDPFEDRIVRTARRSNTEV